jgi:hypothetical protein
MSNKFEQLLDLLVNEEMDKANELFHEIVVEKSREIYENMIAEEAEEDEEMDEAMDSDEEMDESMGDDLEEETTLEIGGDAGDNFVSDVSDDDAMGGMDDMGGDAGMDGDLGAEGEGSEEQRISDLESELEQLKSEFEALMADEKDEPGHDDMFGDEESDDEEGEEADDEEGDDEEADDEEGGEEFMREYVETVSAGHGADKKGKGEDGGTNTKSVGLQNPKGRPTTTASAHNILGGKGGEAGIKGGEGLVGGQKGEFTKDHLNKPGGFKGDAMKKNGAGHGAEKKGAGEGAAYTKSPADRMQ